MVFDELRGIERLPILAAAPGDTATTGKRGTTPAKPLPPIANLSKPHMVWLIVSFVLTIIVPPVGSVLLLWAIAKILVLKLKTSNTNA